MTTSPTHSPLKRLRAVIPQRSVSFDEALRVAEHQAALLYDLLDEGDGIRDIHIAGLPRIAVTYEPLSVSGMSHWNGTLWIIAINRGDSLPRQRFTLLHEFKHIVDHGYSHQLYQGTRRRTPAQEAEAAADYFAGCALLPKRQLKSAWGNGIQRVPALAEHFGVSEQAVRVRLAQTGLDAGEDRAPQARCARPVSTPRTHSQRFIVRRPHYSRKAYA